MAVENLIRQFWKEEKVDHRITAERSCESAAQDRA